MSYVHHVLFVFAEFMQMSAHMNQEYWKYNENELFLSTNSMSMLIMCVHVQLFLPVAQVKKVILEMEIYLAFADYWKFYLLACRTYDYFLRPLSHL